MKKIVIIGSGIGGLVTGNLLAQKGYEVTIFESHRRPGGYTAGFWRKGFYFESGTLSFEASDRVFRAMKNIGVFENIEFIRQKIRWVSEDFDGTPESYNDFKDMFYSAYPSEKDRLGKYFSEVDRIYDAIFSPGSDRAKAMMVYQEYMDVTATEFAERFFEKGSKLCQIFKGIGYPEMSALNIGGVATFFSDYWTVKTGMQSWADVLADNFEKLGGKLKLKSYVDKILTKNGVAVGVSSKKTDYEADCVISASDYKKTFLKLLDDQSLIPNEMQERIKQASVSEGFFTVYLGLRMPNEKLREYMKIPHVMYSYDKPDADIFNPDDEDFFEKTSISLYSPSLMNPELAPEGKSSLMIQTMTPHKWMQNWGGGDRRKYRDLKEKVSETLVKKASSFIPGLADLIEFEDAATPLTYERYTHNTDGASSAWSWNPKKRFYMQPIGVVVDTPVKNLFIGSCWANQMGGVPGAISAAYKCVEEIG